MPRSRTVIILLIALLASLGAPSGAIAPSSAMAAPVVQDVSVRAPKAAELDVVFGITLILPPEVAAVDGRVLVTDGAAEVIGLAPAGAGTAFRPEVVADGFAVGAYDMQAVDGQTRVDIALVPLKAGRLHVRIVIDAAANAAGERVILKTTEILSKVTIAGGARDLVAPKLNGHEKPGRAPRKVKELVRDGRFDRRDVDVARGEWTAARTSGIVCAGAGPGDVNEDGCTDIVDVQALAALEGTEVGKVFGTVILASAKVSPAGDVSVRAVTAAPLRTFTVRSALDTADAAPGNGVCADAAGLCTLRAAMTEADYLAGEDRIAFDLVGSAPVRIQLNGRLPMITSRSGGVTIDGYSQPGSAPNTATFGSNAIPGVEIRGNGTAAKEMAIYITSPGNIIRGLLFGNVWRGLFLDGIDARDNRIIGNWLGFQANQDSAGGEYGIVLNTRSNRNVIGTPALADRNVIGNWNAGVDEYGPGTDFNVIQNNLFCIRPNGGLATCSTGIDHNFGPKSGLIGGTGTNERNVFGPTKLQGIELSHGYNPVGTPGTDFSITYQINNNRVIGNWVGFKADGNYDAAYRSALYFSNGDNGQAINVYDGSSDNLVEGNHIGSVYDGIQTMAPTAQRNIIRNNIIGESPLGQPAPLTRWGVVVRWGSTLSIVEGNTIKNAAAGGIGLLNTNNRGLSQSPAYNIKLTRNIVANTNGPAIDLFGVAGPDPNDPGDGDDGANSLLNTPVITSASTSSVRGTAAPGATVEVYSASRAAGQFGLPTAYLGAATVAGDGTWTVGTSSSVGQVVTALQITTDANTSELGANVAVAGAGSEAPSITSAASTTFVVGSAGSFTVTASGTPTPSISAGGTLPAGVSFVDNGNGSGTLSGTPAAGTAGSYPITFTASNGLPPNATQNFTLQINAAPTITSAAQTTFVVGTAGSFTVTTTGRPDAVITRTGALPGGVSFTDNGNGSGTLSGTPGVGSEGNYPITFTASNGISPAASQGFTLTVDPPVVGGPFAADAYSRTVTGGWGTADQGGPWTITSSPSNFSVNGSAGRISLSAGATRMARLGSVSALNANIFVAVTADRLPAGNNLFYYVVGRRTGTDTEYRAKVRIAADGKVYVQPVKAVANVSAAMGPEVQVAGLVAAPGTALAVRVQYAGASPTLIRMRVWQAGSAEPSVWHASQTDSEASLQAAGAIGLRAYLGSTTTNGPVLVSFDDLVVTP